MRTTTTLLFLLALLPHICIAQGSTTTSVVEATPHVTKSSQTHVHPTPTTTEPLREPRIENPPFGQDLDELENAWANATFAQKDVAQEPYKALVGLIKNERWVDPAKLDGAIQNLVNALPPTDAGADRVVQALKKLYQDFVGVIATQSLPYQATIAPFSVSTPTTTTDCANGCSQATSAATDVPVGAANEGIRKMDASHGLLGFAPVVAILLMLH